MVFHWSLYDSKSPQVYRTLLSSLAVRDNGIVWMVSTRSPTSKSFRPFNNPLITVPKAPITICIIVTFMFHSLFFLIPEQRWSYYYYHYYSLIRAFHISVSRWFFTGVWVTASLFKSSGLFSVFWAFSIMLSFGWSPLVRQLPSPPVPLVIL